MSLMFLSHFDVCCSLLLNRHMATSSLFVLYIIMKKQSDINGDVISAFVLQ